MHCSTGLSKMHSLLLSVALQNGLTAGLCHGSYTCGDLLLIQVCNEAAEMHCITGLSKSHSLLCSGALENRLTTGTVSLPSHLWRFAPHTAVQ